MYLRSSVCDTGFVSVCSWKTRKELDGGKQDKSVLGGYKASENPETVASPPFVSGCHTHVFWNVTTALATCANSFIQIKIAQGMGYPNGQRKQVSSPFTRHSEGEVQVLRGRRAYQATDRCRISHCSYSIRQS